MLGGWMPYEQGMHIKYDPTTRTVLIIFRGTTRTLGPFNDKITAVFAAEDLCRRQGWEG